MVSYHNLQSSLTNANTGLDRPWGFQEVEVSRFQDSQHVKVVRLSAVCTGRLYPTQEIFLVLISVRGCQPQGHSAARRIMSMKNSNDTIVDRTHNLLACGAVPQPTAPPCAPNRDHYNQQISFETFWYGSGGHTSSSSSNSILLLLLIVVVVLSSSIVLVVTTTIIIITSRFGGEFYSNPSSIWKISDFGTFDFRHTYASSLSNYLQGCKKYNSSDW
jgi:hypothetical protein